MDTLVSNDSFDAFKTENGIEIHEKKAAAKKFSIVIIVVGIVFFLIGLIPMEGLTFKWITTLFTSVFLYGGVLLFILGLLVLLIKGTGDKAGPVTIIDGQTQRMTSRGKEIPFSEIGPLTLQTTEVMGKKMTALLYTHNGKKKGFVGGTVITEDIEGLEKLVSAVNDLTQTKNT